jgi:thioredoxin 1
LAENIINVTDVDFDEVVLKSELPVLVDFWAVWCVPCKMIAPLVDEMAGEYKDKLKVCKVNVDENLKVPSRYGIRGIPTLLLFKGGELKETMVGVLPKDKITSTLTKYL